MKLPHRSTALTRSLPTEATATQAENTHTHGHKQHQVIAIQYQQPDKQQRHHQPAHKQKQTSTYHNALAGRDQGNRMCLSALVVGLLGCGLFCIRVLLHPSPAYIRVLPTTTRPTTPILTTHLEALRGVSNKSRSNQAHVPSTYYIAHLNYSTCGR